MTNLVWFRNDLRITDNPTLTAACKNGAAVIGIYIATPGQWRKHNMSAWQTDLIAKRLEMLRDDLAAIGVPFYYKEALDYQDSLSVIERFIQERNIEQVFYNRQYEYNERRRDQALTDNAKGVSIHAYDGNLLYPIATVLNQKQLMYKVFTPFSRALLKHLNGYAPDMAAKPHENDAISAERAPINFNYPRKESSNFLANEQEIHQVMAEYLSDSVINYDQARDNPALDATSKLSAYLAIGALSVKQCFYCLQEKYPQFWLDKQSGASVWFNELIWREFYQNLIYYYDSLSKGKAFIEWTDAIQWSEDNRRFLAWQEGRTGYPIVDAAMRQLNQTGWMHNRLRMITASFLVKDLQIDWRKGERYFMQNLIDGDFAANNGGWQWAASTGTDAVPYFRIFNPSTQSKRFDPEGIFIKKYLPELASVPEKYIHEPIKWSGSSQLNYPEPIVEHSEARKKTLAIFQDAKEWYSFLGEATD